jgi:uncharacterized repeat protein (TIGR03803 family)
MAILVFAVATSTNIHAQTYSVLFNFNNSDGGTTGTNAGPAFPGVVAQGRDGNLYSTTARGGVNQSGEGAIFQVTPAGTLTTVHSFSLGVAPGSPYTPQSGLTLGTDGFFYGTSSAENGFDGAIFKADSSGNVTVLYSFRNKGDGGAPWTPPIQGTDGSLYGTTSNADGVYKLTPDGTFTELHAFGLLVEESGGHHRQTKAQRPLSKKTVQNIAGVLSSAFKRAIKWGLVTANPVSASEPPVPKKRRGIALTPAQQEMFIVAATRPWYLSTSSRWLLGPARAAAKSWHFAGPTS